METPSLCLNCLVCILVAAASEMPRDLNHCVLPLCFAGLAELCARVRLSLDQNTWIQCEVGPASSALLWVCGSWPRVTLLKADLSREGWQLFSFAIPAMPCRNLSHREREHGKEKDRCNFLTPTGGEARAGCQMPQKTSCCVVYFLESQKKRHFIP